MITACNTYALGLVVQHPSFQIMYDCFQLNTVLVSVCGLIDWQDTLCKCDTENNPDVSTHQSNFCDLMVFMVSPRPNIAAAPKAYVIDGPNVQ